MLDIFATHYSLTESVGFGDCTPHKFSGTFNEAASEFAYLLKSNAYDIHSYVAKSDEIIAECMMSDQAYKVDTLVENVFKDLFDQAKKFWAKLKEWVKGLINKLKAFVYQLTGQYSKWASTMKTRVANASPSDFTYVMHDWNGNVLGKLCNLPALDTINGATGDFLSKVSKVANSMANRHINIANTTADKTSMSAAADASGSDDYKLFEQEVNDDAADRIIHGVYNMAAKEIGFTADNYDMKTFRANIAKAVTGGEKITKKIDSSTASKMFNDVSNASETLKSVEKAYKDTLAALDKETKSISDLESVVSKATAHDVTDQKAVTNIKTMMTKSIHLATRICKSSRDLINEIGNSATKYTKQYVFECMSCLSAYCNAGDKQNKNTPPTRNANNAY